MSYMDIQDIRKKFYNDEYSCKMAVPQSVKENHVFDENLSVKQNREMVREHNERAVALRKERDRKNNELHQQMRNDVIQYIVHTYGLSKDQASIIESYVYTEKHSFMGDYFIYIDDISEMVEQVIRSES